MSTPAQPAAPAPAPAPPDTVAGAAKSAPILPLIALGFGAYLLWFGVRYWKGSGPAVWPSYPVRSVLQGKGVPSNQLSAVNPAATLTAYETATAAAITDTAAQAAAQPGVTAAAGAGGATGTGQAPGTHTAGGRGSGSSPPAGGANPSANANRGKLLAAKRGWTGSQWDALNNLWGVHESGWNNLVWNGGSTAPTKPANSSGAYGIAQALPFNKMPQAAWPPGYGGRADPTAQIEWGLAYIAGRYGTPAAALAHENAIGWY